jgi:hypothetical protein
VHFVVDKVLGEKGEGMPTTAEQRKKSRSQLDFSPRRHKTISAATPEKWTGPETPPD